MFFDPLYWLIIGIGMVLSIWASLKTKGTFHKYSQFTTRSRMTGAGRREGHSCATRNISDVKVEPVQGRSRTLRPAPQGPAPE